MAKEPQSKKENKKALKLGTSPIQQQIAEGKTEGVVAEFPADKVISMEEAMKLINPEDAKNSYEKKSAKQRKAEAMQKQDMNRQITKGEFISQMQSLAENIDMGLQEYHNSQIVPTQQAINRLESGINATRNLSEVIVETLIRKGVIDVEFLKSVQEEMIQKALEEQTKLKEANDEALEHDKEITTTKEEENNVTSNHENSGEEQR